MSILLDKNLILNINLTELCVKNSLHVWKTIWYMQNHNIHHLTDLLNSFNIHSETVCNRGPELQ